MTENEDISFSDYTRKHIDRMIDNGQVRNAKNYQLALGKPKTINIAVKKQTVSNRNTKLKERLQKIIYMVRMNDFLFNINLNELNNFIESQGTVRLYRKDESLCKQGQLCRRIAIIRNGYFKYSVVNSNGKVCITGFSFYGEVVTDFVCSFIFGKASFTSITAGCDAEVIEVDINTARQFMTERHPDFVGHASSHILVAAYRRYLDVHTKTPKQRYVDLISRCHEDISLIPLQEMASYLSISRRQLQRIRETNV